MTSSHISDRPVFDLTRFALADMTRCGVDLRRLGDGASTMEEVAERVVRYLYERLRAPDIDAPACVLVRLFVTMPFTDLAAEEQAFARRILGSTPETPRMKCLTLLATAGD